ncbi:hypothetical protein CYY_006897 [Polysphondylium violaceum]|uniref:GH18 domain-containing protein n=1 Tax=Polysphondylium violaceum TaxID=133409 RepID=A0A8J4UXZ5_9MYCE|nr:hypothetical protein CYY_006897 [Polysphondylium violaceum]
MKYLTLLVFLVATLSFAASLSSSSVVDDIKPQKIQCPCSNKTLCQPINPGNERKELFIFSIVQGNYKYYDWSQITTYAVFYPDPVGEALCVAHENNARLVFQASYPLLQLTNSTYKKEWIKQQIDLVENNYADGINIDFEASINDTQNELSALYTALVAEVSLAMKKVNPNYQVTVDVPYAPYCTFGRCYDYLGLSQAADFLVLMFYDLFGSYPANPCIAGPNSPLLLVPEGLENFTLTGVTKDKLVMAIPWYGYTYKCQNATNLNLEDCSLEQNVNGQVTCPHPMVSMDYGAIVNMIQDPKNKTSGPLWSDKYSSVYLNYVDQQETIHQVWYDDEETIELKVNIAKKYSIRGISSWNADQLDYSDKISSSLMWDSFKPFFEQQM